MVIGNELLMNVLLFPVFLFSDFGIRIHNFCSQAPTSAPPDLPQATEYKNTWQTCQY